MKRLDKQFFEQPTTQLARQLLGCRFVHLSEFGTSSGWITETEAYLHQDDSASHSAKGLTNRNRSMFGPPGRLYVYSIHNRFCMNIVSESEGLGAAVLIRAIEPDCGIELMLLRRPTFKTHELTNGPGKLCQALGISKLHDGVNLTTSQQLWLEEKSCEMSFSIRTSSRIGIRQSQELPLRFFIDGNLYVSGRASDHSSPRRRTMQNNPRLGS